MPQKVLKFTGINRKVNEFQNTGACEELINLRPDIDGACRVVKDNVVYIEDAQYDLFIEHSWGNHSNHIAIDGGVVKWVNTPSGAARRITDTFQGKKITVSTAGNILVVYCESQKQQEVFRFKDDEYKTFEISVGPKISAEIAYAYGVATNSAAAEDTSAGAYNEAMQKVASGFNQKYPNGLCGAAVVGCTYELKDGSEVWSTSFIVANSEYASITTPPQIHSDTQKVSVSGAKKVYLDLRIEGDVPDEVERINVYATRAVFPYVIENDANVSNSALIEKRTLEQMNLAGQLMYYQGSVSTSEKSAKVLLNFGLTQSGEKVMDVTAGCIERVGETVSYNNRFHYFKSDVNHIIQAPSASRDSKIFVISYADGTEEFFENDREQDGDTLELSYWIAYVKLKDQWKLINKVYSFPENKVGDFIYPMSGVEKMAFVKATMGDNGITVPYQSGFFVDMKDSTAYNYSYAFGVKAEPVYLEDDIVSEWHNAVQWWGYPTDSKVLWEEETNEINVSAQFNPFVFPVNNSYSVGGEIKDISTSYLPISSTQIGQFPITIFTTNGIFALEQGSGAVLYGSVIPLQPHIIEGKALATPHGTFFISSSSLYVISGREAVDVSYALDGEIESGIRMRESYKDLCLNENGDLYNFTEMLSNEGFTEYIADALLSYDQLNNEVIISNPNKKYSYVFNIDTKKYHKVSKTFRQAHSNSRYAIEDNDGIKSVVDMFFNVRSGQQNILLQSRPFALEAFFTHIQRLILFVDAKLNAGQNLCFSVFASDNLSDWKCIISAQKKDTVLRQIRTNKAAKSYRDYVILINGTVGTDTDLAEIIADYTVVSRRLG